MPQVFPSRYDWHKAHLLELPFRYPFLKNLVISLQSIEANHHSGYIQSIALRWIRTGFGGLNRPRPLFLCERCGRRITKLYFQYGSLKCRRCANATYASRACSKRLRPILQAKRLQALLEFKFALSQRNRRRLQARITTAPTPTQLQHTRRNALAMMSLRVVIFITTRIVIFITSAVLM